MRLPEKRGWLPRTYHQERSIGQFLCQPNIVPIHPFSKPPSRKTERPWLGNGTGSDAQMVFKQLPWPGNGTGSDEFTKKTRSLFYP